MKFDFVIGNPPFNENQESTSDDALYNHIMDASYEISDKVEFITPAKFLFNAGKTPAKWNEKMLNDEHLKVLYYEKESRKVFKEILLKGGVVITYRDARKFYGAIEVFSQYSELNSILNKIRAMSDSSISDIVFSPESYKFTNDLYNDYPELLDMTWKDKKGKEVPLISKGHQRDLTTNIFDKLKDIVFFEKKPEDKDEYMEIVGRLNDSRSHMWIRKKYIAEHENLGKYKLLFPKSTGSGIFGEQLSDAIVAMPGTGHTQTFLSMGMFEKQREVEALNFYIKTKFARALLGVLKVTQDNKRKVWKYVPLQDFSEASDIDWSQSIADIDQQLYKKYGLSQEEIDFIENNVKEMK